MFFMYGVKKVLVRVRNVAIKCWYRLHSQFYINYITGWYYSIHWFRVRSILHWYSTKHESLWKISNNIRNRISGTYSSCWSLPKSNLKYSNSSKKCTHIIVTLCISYYMFCIYIHRGYFVFLIGKLMFEYTFKNRFKTRHLSYQINFWSWLSFFVDFKQLTSSYIFLFTWYTCVL